MPSEPKPKRPIHHSRQLDHEQLLSLINSMADGVIAVDKQHIVSAYNGAALNILDRNDSIRGKRVNNLCKLVDKNKQPVDLSTLIDEAATPTLNRDLRLRYEDDSMINLFLNISPVYQGYKSAGGAGFVLVLRDITREKSLEEERDEFISVVSHELRTPIAITEGVISNAQFIAGKTGDLKQIRTALKEAHDQTLFLADMINDLATLSRAERGKLAIDVGPINVHDMVEGLINSYGVEARDRGLLLSAEIDPKLELLQSSKLYVREVLQNFITNAMKYTEHGRITIAAKSKSGGVIFTVSDTGIGISKSDQERVFDKFFRSEDFRTRKTGGTGLGLYVTIKLARLMHAELSLESKLNHGSTFTIIVPDLA